ncbi:expressed unknown protein [Seminavis robusta]|uniref:RING-type domain-containing protein n=1 Tax=Seminavis robusta TaxID=568900 RepID=A0A9N8HP99_9STRA|nr:expressed unknown protein [Seminavis robusta]|eukprot:Sro1305_g261160.1 n/a (368) ;mRNA; r:12260-13457
MDFSMEEHNQTCAICLESLLKNGTSGETSSSSQTKIGAVVPCGHVFHHACYRKWHSAQERRRRRDSANNNNNSHSNNDDNKCKCPMCNVPCNDFVKLFMGSESSSSHSRRTSASSAATTNEGDDESLRLQSSRKSLDRVKDKLNRYKKENRTLEKKLQDERKLMESTLERTVERHSKEKRSFQRKHQRLEEQVKEKDAALASTAQELQALKEELESDRIKWKKHAKRLEQKLVQEMEGNTEEHLAQVREWGRRKATLKKDVVLARAETKAMQQEIDRTVELQVAERRQWEQKEKQWKQELEKAQQEKAKADARVAKAVQGISQMRAFHEIRKEHVAKLEQEKAQLAQQLQELQPKAELDEEVLLFGS